MFSDYKFILILIYEIYFDFNIGYKNKMGSQAHLKFSVHLLYWLVEKNSLKFKPDLLHSTALIQAQIIEC